MSKARKENTRLFHLGTVSEFRSKATSDIRIKIHSLKLNNKQIIV